jgi:serine O-acetyltransferase
MTLRELIRSDLSRFHQTYALRGQPFSHRRVLWESLMFKAGFQAVLLYRLSHSLHARGWVNTAWLVSRVSQAITGAEIEFNARIGPGMLVAHAGGIVIGRGTVIGAGATIFQGVTFGARNWHPRAIREFPQVGDRCFFFTGATVLGNVAIGDDCVVGAHAVVTTDLPAGSMAVGNPAKVYADRGREAVAAWSATAPA